MAGVSDKIVIEKGVSLKASNPGGRKSGPPKLPFDVMDVGDSFVLPAEVGVLTSKAYYWGVKLGRKFAVRTIDDKHCRIWRIK